MGITTISSRELNHDVGRAKRASALGPVFITDRGKVAHVLLSIDEYERITDKKENIVDLLSMREAAEIDFEPEKYNGKLFGEADFT